MNKHQWILGITRGHNAGVCLLKDGKIVFSMEEERLSRVKYDGAPFATMAKVLEYTKKLDYIAIAHTDTTRNMIGVDYSWDDPYTALARKLRLIDPIVVPTGREGGHPQVVDFGHMHHKLHAASAFYRSGFDEAVAVVVDGAGSCFDLDMNGEKIQGWEVESIINCQYPANMHTIYKHMAANHVRQQRISWQPLPTSDQLDSDNVCELIVTEHAGIVKAYEAVTKYCGFSEIEAGKTMGLFPYGNPNPKIPQFFDSTSIYPFVNRMLVTPSYPQGARINGGLFEELYGDNSTDLTTLQNRRDLAYALQTQTQNEVLRLIFKAVEMSGCKNVVLSGGYALNCVANYWYLQHLTPRGINLYVEPISNDGGTSIGAAYLLYRQLTGDNTVYPQVDTVYHGPVYDYTDTLTTIVAQHEIVDASDQDVVDLVRNKNIVALFQGTSENGPRALGNRSLIFDPTFKDGKDFVNEVKRREYFRPFAASILKEYVHDWFDLRGMEESPTMMYAVNALDGVAEKVPSVIHVDNTCRIQTVTEDQNKLYYRLIKCFYEQTGMPMLFNTSFNLGGEPLVETLEDAIDTLEKSKIEYLYLPEYGKLIKVPNH